MTEEIITRDSAAFKELRRDIVKAIRAVDILIDTHRPTIGNELYLTSEEICSIFSISKRSLQNYRDNRQIPYTTLGGKILSRRAWRRVRPGARERSPAKSGASPGRRAGR